MYRKRNVPTDPKDLPQWLDQELRNLEQAQQAPVSFLALSELHKEPAKLIVGMTVLADGTDWNPGAGQGVYAYYAGSWKKLG